MVNSARLWSLLNQENAHRRCAVTMRALPGRVLALIKSTLHHQMAALSLQGIKTKAFYLPLLTLSQGASRITPNSLLYLTIWLNNSSVVLRLLSLMVDLAQLAWNNSK
jgi:hypothetical protein